MSDPSLLTRWAITVYFAMLLTVSLAITFREEIGVGPSKFPMPGASLCLASYMPLAFAASSTRGADKAWGYCQK